MLTLTAMRGVRLPLAVPRDQPLAGGRIVVLAVVVSLVAGCGTASHTHTAPAVARPAATLPNHPPADPGRLAPDINRAQAVIDSPASSRRQLAAAGLFQELATGTLAAAPARTRKAALAMLGKRAGASMRANLAASGSLSSITPRHKRLPRWRIVQPPPPAVLLRYYRIAQARSHVSWQYLAAIELIESRFGRVHGPSSAGAQGPMQFEPSTWAAYGRGSIYDQRQAILAAARFLVANGAPTRMREALYRYNNSSGYVAAVRAYATRIRADPRAYDGYYYWQVIYPLGRRTVILPVGYPRAHALPVP